MIKIGVLGVGQAGGNIAENGYHSFITGAINFQKDLETLSRVKHKFTIPKGHGAGKDRNKGIKAVQEHYQPMLDFVLDTFKGIDILYVAFSLGGGTGSGTAPILIDLLLDTVEYPVGAIVVLPEKDEDPTAQVNTTKALTELTNIEGMASVFIIDNHIAKLNYPHYDKKKLFDYTNNYVIDNLLRVLELTKKTSNIANFDPEDSLNLLSTPGYAVISSATLKEKEQNNYFYTKESIAADIMTSWENTISPPFEYKIGCIQKAGVIAEIKQGISDRLDYNEIFKNTGKPLTLFTGIYPNIPNTVTTILAGMEYPFKRFEEIDSILEENKDQIQKMLTGQRGYTSKLDWFNQDELRPNRRNKATGKTEINVDKFKKYGK